MEHILMRVNR